MRYACLLILSAALMAAASAGLAGPHSPKAYFASENCSTRKPVGLGLKALGSTSEPVRVFYRSDGECYMAWSLPGNEPATLLVPSADKHEVMVLGVGMASRWERVVPSESIQASLVSTLSAHGLVRTSSGGPVRDAVVVLEGWRNTTLGRASVVRVDARGYFEVSALPLGERQLSFRAPGMIEEVVTLKPDSDVRQIVQVEMIASQKGKKYRYGGIGAELARVPGGWGISYVRRGSPADGLVKSGEMIETVNGVRVSDLSADEVIAMVRGRAGLPVNLEIRSAEGLLRSVTLLRERVVAP